MQRPRNDSDSGYYGYFLCLCQDKATMPSLLDEGGPVHFGCCRDIPLARSLPTLIGFCHGFCGGDFDWKPLDAITYSVCCAWGSKPHPQTVFHHHLMFRLREFAFMDSKARTGIGPMATIELQQLSCPERANGIPTGKRRGSHVHCEMHL